MTDKEKWTKELTDIHAVVLAAKFAAIDKVVDALAPATMRLLALQKRIEESMAEPAPAPKELRELLELPNLPRPFVELDSLMARGFVPGAYLRRKDDDVHVFFLEYYAHDGGMVFRDVDTRTEYYATVKDLAAVADQWETVPEDEACRDDEEDDGR